jgi:hypothetical protein
MSAELEAVLKTKNISVIIDRSMSMNFKDSGDISRWDSAKESVYGVCLEAEKFDDDGLDVYLFNDTHEKFNGISADKVYGIFDENRPCGSTALGDVLEVAFSDYFERKKAGNAKEGEVFLVVTDGAPDSKQKVYTALVEAASQVTSPTEIGVSFIQVGSDKGATAFLKELDDDLVAKHGAKYDIVDTLTVKEMNGKPSLTEVLINALTD